MKITKADWNKHILIESARDKDALKYMIDNNIDFTGFQGFLRASFKLDDAVPESLPYFSKTIVSESNEEHTEAKLFGEYFHTMFENNDGSDYLCFLPSINDSCLTNIELIAFIEYFGIDNIYTLSDGRSLMREQYMINADFINGMSITELKDWLRAKKLDGSFNLSKTTTLHIEVIAYFGVE